MANRTTAVRYARALAEALPGAEALSAAHGELHQAVALLREPEAQRTIGSAVLPGRRRRELTESLFTALGFQPVVKRLVSLLAEGNGLALLPEVEREIGEICDRRGNLVTAEMTTAVETAAERQEEYRRSLERATGRKVRLRTRVDPAILGGVVTRMGSEVHDGSLRRQLELLQQRLRGE